MKIDLLLKVDFLGCSSYFINLMVTLNGNYNNL